MSAVANDPALRAEHALTDGLDEVLEALDVLLVRVAPQMAACNLTDETLQEGCCDG